MADETPARVQYVVATVAPDDGPPEHVVFMIHDDTPQWWRRIAAFADHERAQAYAEIENLPPIIERPREAPAPAEIVARTVVSKVLPAHVVATLAEPTRQSVVDARLDRIHRAILECAILAEKPTQRRLSDMARINQAKVWRSMDALAARGDIKRDGNGHISHVRKPDGTYLMFADISVVPVGEFTNPHLAAIWLRQHGHAVSAPLPGITTWKVDDHSETAAEVVHLANRLRRADGAVVVAQMEATA